MTILNENELKMTSPMILSLRISKKRASMPYFQNLKLKEMIKLTPEEYINNLLMNGAEEAEIKLLFYLHFNDRVTIV